MTALLTVDNLVVDYGTGRPAVDGVSLTLAPGETLGLGGESGSGKSSIARAVMGLQDFSGSIRFEDHELRGLRARSFRELRPRLQMIFQDPYATLDPRMTVGAQIAEPLVTHRIVDRAEVRPMVASLLERVGLPGEVAARYPHQFSGGQRQRIAIARAVGLSPRLIVCDEPTSALDVSVQAQVLDLLEELQRDQGQAYLFIAHNLGIVRRMCHRVAVMYLGRVVETGPVDEVFDNPQHPYTKALLDAVLDPDPASRHAVSKVRADLTSPIDLVEGTP